MINPVLISIVALCISIAGFGFSIFQWRKSSFIKIAEKTHEVTLEAFALRRSSQDLRNLIAITDDIDDMEYFLQELDSVSEKMLKSTLRNPSINLSEVYMAQQKISDLRLELDLLHKQVEVAKRFNEEATEYERTKNNP